eukprot:TRINITY_DN9206_c0_g1_i2.p1 TRINITY_DN9206_c0_g1~~TRINITY_DN9206_c0_g1_i2.p1  ORF type:complete len:632 (+),score=120.50 TRINITY_DN9206_c0_g1_i2:63-1958(+)
MSTKSLPMRPRPTAKSNARPLTSMAPNATLSRVGGAADRKAQLERWKVAKDADRGRAVAGSKLIRPSANSNPKPPPKKTQEKAPHQHDKENDINPRVSRQDSFSYPELQEIHSAQKESEKVSLKKLHLLIRSPESSSNANKRRKVLVKHLSPLKDAQDLNSSEPVNQSSSSVSYYSDKGMSKILFPNISSSSFLSNGNNDSSNALYDSRRESSALSNIHETQVINSDFTNRSPENIDSLLESMIKHPSPLSKTQNYTTDVGQDLALSILQSFPPTPQRVEKTMSFIPRSSPKHELNTSQSVYPQKSGKLNILIPDIDVSISRKTMQQPGFSSLCQYLGLSSTTNQEDDSSLSDSRFDLFLRSPTKRLGNVPSLENSLIRTVYDERSGLEIIHTPISRDKKHSPHQSSNPLVLNSPQIKSFSEMLQEKGIKFDSHPKATKDDTMPFPSPCNARKTVNAFFSPSKDAKGSNSPRNIAHSESAHLVGITSMAADDLCLEPLTEGTVLSPLVADQLQNQQAQMDSVSLSAYLFAGQSEKIVQTPTEDRLRAFLGVQTPSTASTMSSRICPIELYQTSKPRRRLAATLLFEEDAREDLVEQANSGCQVNQVRRQTLIAPIISLSQSLASLCAAKMC